MSEITFNAIIGIIYVITGICLFATAMLYAEVKYPNLNNSEKKRNKFKLWFKLCCYISIILLIIIFLLLIIKGINFHL
jgi:uncharacterized membrane protein